MAIPVPPMQTLATMIFDGVLERFPDLRIGVIEQGRSLGAELDASRWSRRSTPSAATRNDSQTLSLRPSEYVRAPGAGHALPTEDVGWIIDQIGPRSCCSPPTTPTSKAAAAPSSDFERSLGDRSSETVRDRFYCDNFVDLMGSALIPTNA